MKNFAMLLAAGAVATALGCAEATPESTSTTATDPAVAGTTETPSNETADSQEPAGTDSDVRLVSLSVPNMV